MPKLTIIAVTYSHPIHILNRFISSLQCQTNDSFHCYIIHDGLLPYFSYEYDHIKMLSRKLNIEDDYKFSIIERQHTGVWGHHHRKWAIENLELGEVTHLTNADNFYLPIFVDKVLKKFEETDADIVLNDSIHNYFGFVPFKAEPRINYCDFVNFTVKTELLRRVGFNHPNEFAADGLLINELAAATNKIAKIPDEILAAHC